MKLLFVLLLLCSVASAQRPPNYTPISSTSYEWTRPGGFSSGLYIPAGDGAPSFDPKAWVRAGSVYYDSTGKVTYVWDGSEWDIVGGNGIPLQDGIVIGCNGILNGSDYTVTLPCVYNIGGTQYSLSAPSTVAIDAGDADPGEFRGDAVVVDTSSSAAIKKGTNSSGGIGDYAQADPASEIAVAYVRIDEDNAEPTQSADIVRDEGAGGEASVTTFGTITISNGYTTNPYNGTISQRITAVTANSGWYYQKASGYWYKAGNVLSGFIKLNSNSNRNYTFRLYNNGTQVGTGSANLSGYGVDYANTSSYQPFSINLQTVFATGIDSFNRIRITATNRTGTGTDAQFDFIQIQKTNQPINQPIVLNDVYRSNASDTIKGKLTDGTLKDLFLAPNPINLIHLDSTGKLSVDSNILIWQGGKIVGLTPKSALGKIFGTTDNVLTGNRDVNLAGYTMNIHDGLFYLNDFLFNAGGVAVLNGREIQLNGNSRFTAYQQTLTLMRRWPHLPDGYYSTFVEIANDTTWTAPGTPIDSARMRLLNISFTNHHNNTKTDKFWWTADGGFYARTLKDTSGVTKQLVYNPATMRVYTQTISGGEGGGDGEWGSITGTLSDQTDLQEALDDKADAADVQPFNLNAPTEGQILAINDDGEIVNIDPPTYSSSDSIPELSANPSSTSGINRYINTVTHRLRFRDSGFGYWYEVAVTDSFPTNPATEINFNSTSGTVTESPADTWTFGASARGSSNQGLAGNGSFTWSVGDQAGFVVGLDSTTTLEAYASFDFAVFTASGTVYATSKGSNTTLGSDAGITDYRISRTGSSLILEKKVSGSWSTLHTYGATTSSTLYPKAENTTGGNKSLVNPSGTGF